ncbi:CBS domain-containing protein CBSX6 [Impatiens glandulifera]|uniref:CBS domain-containing protein CBSX6 n=1 Tax=Impatiens glandulifera TaxID=253017 RepID=UPI001FB15404|nr:CBS domain-containing protein CBSX6 [Impatiens glandulifera]XP_047311548.1 CBS domain-containing protein CBSX6 [Impatiens glandulifera]XP_047311549.1 CBS domain-containing protein CBSX6 [Impatiens glandulifera]
MAASVFLYHVIGDLTLGKPELEEFTETETVEAAIRAIGESMEGEIPVWKKKSASPIEDFQARQLRFVGILNSLDIVAFLAREDCLLDQEKALKTPVYEIVVPNGALLKQVDPATRLIDALEMMKQGVRRLLVPKSVGWKGMSKRFSMMYNGKWLKNLETSSNNLISTTTTDRLPSFSSRILIRDKFCCLSREDVIRFLIGCLGALAPLPLSSITSLGGVNLNYHFIESSLPAMEATKKLPQSGAGPCAVAVVEAITGSNKYKIIGEISSYQLWKCDYLSIAWALANLSAGQFVMGVEDNVAPTTIAVEEKLLPKPKKLSVFPGGSIVGRSIMYRGRSTALTCKVTSSLAAVMAQMLSHRASHVWVTEANNEDVLVGVVSYADILCAVTRQPLIHATASRDSLS